MIYFFRKMQNYEMETNYLSRRGSKRGADEGANDESGSKIKWFLSDPEHTLQLFLLGTDSDTTVKAFGRHWTLHRRFLSKSLHLKSMFIGRTERTIELQTDTDPNISAASLDAVFRFFYTDHIEFTQTSLVSILATGVKLQAETLVQRCVEHMVSTIGWTTVHEIYRIASFYGIDGVKRASIEWMKHFFPRIALNQLFRSYDADLIKLLAASPDLAVGCECQLFYKLSRWMYAQLDPTDTVFAIDIFTNRQGQPPFLETGLGQPFIELFRHLRLHNLNNCPHEHVREVERWNILPPAWLGAATFDFWAFVDAKSKETPPGTISATEFDRLCFRFTFALTMPQSEWRLDIVAFKLRFFYAERFEETRGLAVQRLSGDGEGTRTLIVRVKIVRVNDVEETIDRIQTGQVTRISLAKDESCVLLCVDKEFGDVGTLQVNINLMQA